MGLKKLKEASQEPKIVCPEPKPRTGMHLLKSNLKLTLTVAMV
jgi:hypothetical protein